MIRYNEMVTNLVNTVIEVKHISNTSTSSIFRRIKIRKIINRDRRSIKKNISKKKIFTSEEIISFAQFLTMAKKSYGLKARNPEDCYNFRHFTEVYGNDYGGNTAYGEISFVLPYSEYQILKTTIGCWAECAINRTYEITNMNCKWEVMLNGNSSEPNKEYEFIYERSLHDLNQDPSYGPTINEFIDISNKMLYNIFSIGIERVYSSLIERYAK